MFSAEDMSGFEEVLFWRDYYSGDFTIAHGATAYVASGGNNGMLHNYVQSFLMKDGMPWYAATAAYPFKGDERVMDEKANRDERLQLFLFGEYFFKEEIAITKKGEIPVVIGCFCLPNIFGVVILESAAEK